MPTPRRHHSGKPTLNSRRQKPLNCQVPERYMTLIRAYDRKWYEEKGYHLYLAGVVTRALDELFKAEHFNEDRKLPNGAAREIRAAAS